MGHKENSTTSKESKRSRHSQQISSTQHSGDHQRGREGQVTVNWLSALGTMKRGVFKVGPVTRTLISVDRLQETGRDVILTKNKPRIVNLRTGEVMPLRRDGGMFILDMWIWVPTSRTKTERESCSDFARQR